MVISKNSFAFGVNERINWNFIHSGVWTEGMSSFPSLVLLDFIKVVILIVFNSYPLSTDLE